jgi:hypothetical protein
MILTNPLTLLVLSYAVVALSIAFVPPILSMRLAAFGAALAVAVFGLLYADRSQLSIVWLEFCATCTFATILYANVFLLIMKTTPPSDSSWTKRLFWVIDLAFNPRGIGTTWQIRNVPLFSRKDPTYVPSRRSFIIQRIITSVQFYLLTKIFNVVSAKVYIENLQDGDYIEYKESIIRRIKDVSMHELFIRAWLPWQIFFKLWSRNQYLHSFVSVLAVIFGDEPRRWPPMYDYIGEAYSLRKFWGYVSVLTNTLKH